MKYVRLCKGVKDKGKLIPITEDVYQHTNLEDDFYLSIYHYNQEQFDQFQKTGTIKGIKDVTTNKIVFDFDNEANPDEARIEAQKLYFKLTEQYKVGENNIEIYFSGNKGFNLVITIDKELAPKEVQALVEKMGEGVTFDTTLYDAPQILRIPGTKHPKSKLFKIPLTIAQFFNSELSEIKALASNLDLITADFQWDTVTLDKEVYEFSSNKTKLQKPEKSSKIESATISDSINFTNKPSQWKNCKWSLLQGHFGDAQGERHHALTILAATCRGLGYDKETTYYMCKGALKKSASRTGRDEFPKEELWDNIINQSIFSDGWEGGQYSCKSDPWLKKYCDGLGKHKCQDKQEEPSSVTAADMHTIFSDYASNFENNIIKVGNKEMDENVMFVSSSLCGLLGQPGAGKTSFAINYLLNTSLRGIPSMFFSLDMGLPIVYAKLVQKESAKDFKEVMRLYKDDPEAAEYFREQIDDQYKNVTFNFKSGLTVQDIKKSIKDQEEKDGKKIKLVIIDYLECIAGPYSDPTANTGFIANQLKDVANELNVCILLLLQTQKHSTPDIADPLLSLKGVKGSSLIEQSCSVVLTLWRDGYNPNHVKNDKYISFAVVKNRFGSLWKGDFSWNGMTGNIDSLTEEGHHELKQFRELKKLEKVLEAKRLTELEDKASEQAGWS